MELNISLCLARVARTCHSGLADTGARPRHPRPVLAPWVRNQRGWWPKKNSFLPKLTGVEMMNKATKEASITRRLPAERGMVCVYPPHDWVGLHPLPLTPWCMPAASCILWGLSLEHTAREDKGLLCGQGCRDLVWLPRCLPWLLVCDVGEGGEVRVVCYGLLFSLKSLSPLQSQSSSSDDGEHHPQHRHGHYFRLLHVEQSISSCSGL